MEKPELLSAAATNPGCMRDNNEDRFLHDPDKGIFVVIDGVGGHAAGEVAADIALGILGARLRRFTGNAAERIQEGITLANNEIYNSALTSEALQGMACVLTAAVIEDGHVTIGHVGDTRLYKLAKGQLRKITNDHSPIGEREDAGELSELEAMRHPRRNEVYRDVGTELHEPDDQDFIQSIEIPLEPDSALLMCSDGLSDMITSSHMLRIIEEYAPDPEEIVKHLIDAANEAGGRDNITVLFAAREQFSAGRVTNGKSKERRYEATIGPLNIAEKTAENGNDVAEPATDAADSPTVKRRVLVWLDFLRASSWFNSRLTAFLCGVLLCLIVLILLPNGWKRNWLTTDSLTLPTQQPAKRIFVGGNREGALPSINQALAQAKPGDTIEVAPGEYQEQINLREGVILISAEPQGAIIFSPGGTDRRVAVIASGLTSARLVGFKIAGDPGRLLDVGLRIVDSGVEVERTEITGAAVVGVEIESGRSATFIANRIHGNSGGGMTIRGETAPSVINNIIKGNGRGSGEDGAGAKAEIDILEGARPLLLGNIFSSNVEKHIAGLDTEKQREFNERNFFVDDVKANAGENSSPRQRRISSARQSRKRR